METKLKPCRYCGDSWIYYYGEDAPENYKNLGWRVNCKCGLAGISALWMHDKEEAIKSWNASIFALDNSKIL